jgi:hypothetical protein
MVTTQVAEEVFANLADMEIVFEISEQVFANLADMEIVFEISELLAMQISQPDSMLTQIIADQEATPWMKGMRKWIETKTWDEIPGVSFERIQQTAYYYRINENVLYRVERSANTNRELWRVVLPETLRERVTYEVHSSPYSGHQGRRITYEKLQERFYWPRMLAYVRAFCSQCQVCSQYKRNLPPGVRAAMQMIPVDQILGMVGIDVAGPFPKSKQGNRYVLSVVDHLSLWPEAYPMPNKKADTIRRCLLHYVCQYGCPSRILSDRGGEFMAHIMHSVYQLLGVKKINTTAMHPQTNAVVERFHGSFLDLLRTITQGRRASKWEEALPFALFAMRTSYHPAIQDTPFFLMY